MSENRANALADEARPDPRRVAPAPARPLGTGASFALLIGMLACPVIALQSPSARPAGEGITREIFFTKDDVVLLRRKVNSGRPSACAEMLRKLCDFYLLNLNPDGWDFGRIDPRLAEQIEKYLVRLSFQYLLTEEATYATLARKIALKTCEMTWPGGQGDACLRRGLACTLHWTHDRLDEGDRETIRSRLPGGDLSAAIHSPLADLSVDLKSEPWTVYQDGQFGMDFKLGAVVGPPASWYARKAAEHRDPGLQWISDQVFRRFPSKSDWADEVWTIIHYDPELASTKPVNYSKRLESQAIEHRNKRLAAMIRNYLDGPWLPYERDTRQPIRAELVGVHPRLMITPQRLEEVILRGAAIPETLWQPIDMPPFTDDEIYPPGNRGYIAHELMSFVVSYLATRQDYYLEQAIRIMLQACKADRWGQRTDLPDVDMAPGGMLFGFGVAYDGLHDLINKDQRTVILNRLARQCEIMYDWWSKGKWRPSHRTANGSLPYEQNHGFVANIGLWCTAAAILEEVPRAQVWYDWGVEYFKRSLFILNNDDGWCFENINYWDYAYGGNFNIFMDLFRNATGVNTFDAYRRFEKEKYYLLYTLMPGGRYSLNMGDTAEGACRNSPLFLLRLSMMKAASEYRDRQAQGLADYITALGIFPPTDHRGRFTWWDPPSGEAGWMLLWWDPTVSGVDPRTQWPPYHYFNDLDVVCLRNNWADDATHFALRCGPPEGHRATSEFLRGAFAGWNHLYPGHTQSDLNGFTIYDHGEHLAVDTGYPKYGYWSIGRQHNTIAVDGGGQGNDWLKPWSRYGRMGDFFAADQAYYYLCGQAARGFDKGLDLRRFDRHVMMVPDTASTYVLIHDVLVSGKTHRYEWLLHSLARATGSGNRYTITRNERSLTAHLLRPSRLNVTFETVPTKIFPWAVSPNQIYKLVACPPGKTSDQQFLVALTLHASDKAGPDVTMIDGGRAIRISAPEWKDVLSVSGNGGGMAGDGQYAMVRSVGADVKRWGVMNATGLSWRGAPFFQADARCAVAATLDDGFARVTVKAKRPTEMDLFMPFEVRSHHVITHVEPTPKPMNTTRHGPNQGPGDASRLAPVVHSENSLHVSLPVGRHEVILLDKKVHKFEEASQVPTITPPGGIFADGVTVTLEAPDPHARMYYTTDGSNPNPNSNRYTGPIRLNQNAILKAIAYKPGEGDGYLSTISKAVFTIEKSRSPVNLPMVQGLQYDYYEIKWMDFIPDFDRMTATKSGVSKQFDTSLRTRDRGVGFRYRGYIHVPRTGLYKFYLRSKGGSRLYIGDTSVVNNDAYHYWAEQGGRIALKAEKHPIEVRYIDRGKCHGLEVSYEGPGIEKQPIPAKALFYRRQRAVE